MIDFSHFLVISWNVHGVANKATKRHIKELMTTYRPSILCILESHICFDSTKNFWEVLGYHPMAISKANGNSRGIWVLSYISSIFFASVDLHK